MGNVQEEGMELALPTDEESTRGRILSRPTRSEVETSMAGVLALKSKHEEEIKGPEYGHVQVEEVVLNSPNKTVQPAEGIVSRTRSRSRIKSPDSAGARQ